MHISWIQKVSTGTFTPTQKKETIIFLSGTEEYKDTMFIAREVSQGSLESLCFFFMS